MVNGVNTELSRTCYGAVPNLVWLFVIRAPLSVSRSFAGFLEACPVLVFLLIVIWKGCNHGVRPFITTLAGPTPDGCRVPGSARLGYHIF